ncbi:hypothetical protein EZV62_017726 [Acer yangbiense]|uniref:DUF1664 domain-containing protein n=1 Tax=Acer yangbiense TaxID=1000413 RepID=A0A5C7HH77_9ROSI|nr:hypothetical protein EZV62_017726 [Acer yangbiense]
MLPEQCHHPFVEELFGLGVDLKPRNATPNAPKPRSSFGPNGQYIRELPCPSCRGRGYTPCTECRIERSRSDCSLCNGKGIMTCRQCLGDCVIWEEYIDERPWEKAHSISPLKVKEDDEVDNLDIKVDVKKKSKRVYHSPSPEVGLKISRSLKSLNAKTGLFSKRMKIIHRDPKLQAQRVAAIKKVKGTAAARKRASEAMTAFFSDPENRRKRSIAMKGVRFYCKHCGREGHRRFYWATIAGHALETYTCRFCGDKGHNIRTFQFLASDSHIWEFSSHHCSCFFEWNDWKGTSLKSITVRVDVRGIPFSQPHFIKILLTGPNTANFPGNQDQIQKVRVSESEEAMAMQTGISVSRLLFLAGAGYTGTVLVTNGKLSDVLGELQSLVKGFEKSGEQDGDPDLTDAVAAQVRRLAMEVRQLASSSSRQITVLNGDSGGSATSLIIPAATLGALGYGYMWWKGLSFSDLMYVTKKSMATAVSNLTKHLENVSDALSVEEACEDLSKVEHNLKDLQSMIYCLDGKIDSLGYKQDQLKLGDKARLLKAPSSMGLKEITDSLSGTISQSGTDTSQQDGIKLNDRQRLLLRANSAQN